MKAAKTWHDMLNESLEDTNFRKEWKDANAELAEIDQIISAHASVGLTQTDIATQCCDDKKATKIVTKIPTTACLGSKLLTSSSVKTAFPLQE